MRVALVNTNRIKPPIAPIGLEYVAETLAVRGHVVEILDLAWAEPRQAVVRDFFGGSAFDLVGVTLRNTDDCTFTGRHSFLAEFTQVVATIRQCTLAPIVVGGVGFSVMPEEVLTLCGADVGVWGDGEFAFAELAERIEAGRQWQELSNLIWSRDGRWLRNPPAFLPLTDLPAMGRSWLDNRRYFREGGQAGFETKRGCPRGCIYCADPVAKGRVVRERPPQAVADELEHLLTQGIDHLHTCDSEFNFPEAHAVAVCQEMVRRGLGDRLRWYAYCSPVPFSGELAALMRRAGCVGINFGADSGDEGMLRHLGRDHRPEDVLEAARACRQAGMATMLDLLLGGPGESRESLVRTVEWVRKAEPDLAGVAVGVRVYPGTVLAAQVAQGDLQNGLVGGEDPTDPLFFLEPAVAPFVFGLLDDLVGDDARFLFFDPSRPERNYNYDANERLSEAIAAGHRGAYWDILRRWG